MRKYHLIIAAILMMLLSGCSFVDNLVLEGSEIEESNDYQHYETLKTQNLLNSNNVYSINNDSIHSIDEIYHNPTGQIYVSFADSSHMHIAYYSDAKMTTPLSPNGCWMNPGDSIYYKVIYKNNSIMDYFSLSGFRINSYDDSGRHSSTATTLGSDSLVFLIPDNFIGEELSIMPIGKYSDKKVSFSSYWLTDLGTETRLYTIGTWYLDKKAYFDEEVLVNPLSDYSVRYVFDTSSYFFIGCEPACSDASKVAFGEVEFNSEEPASHYSIELHPYISFDINCSEPATYTVNDLTTELKKNKTFTATKLKFNDEIRFTTADARPSISGDYRYLDVTCDKIENGYSYRIVVEKHPASNIDDYFDVKHSVTTRLSPKCQYGKCIFELDGKDVTGQEIEILEGQKLTVTYIITNEEYIFDRTSDDNSKFTLSKTKRTMTIPFERLVHGGTLYCDDLFTLTKKGGGK